MRPTIPWDAASRPTIGDAARLLERATFGASVADIESMRRQGVDAWFDAQLELARVKPSPSEPDRDGSTWLHSIVHGEDQLRQRLAWCWNQIFTAPDRLAPGLHEPVTAMYEALTTHALGNFEQLLHAVAGSSAAPDQFFGCQTTRRDMADPVGAAFAFAEAMLDRGTIGVSRLQRNGAPSIDDEGRRVPAYTCADVVELADVFRRRADAEPIAIDECRRAISGLAAHANVAPFICGQLIRFLVTSNPSPELTEAAVDVFEDRRDDPDQLFYVVKAILTYPGEVTKTGAPAGKLHEPIVRLTRLARAFGSALDAPWPGGRPSSTSGAVHLFEDDDAPMSFPNYLYGLMYGQATGSLFPNFDPVADAALAGVPALLDVLDLVLCSGAMSENTRAVITEAADGIDDAAANGGVPGDRVNEAKVKMAIWVTAVSADAAVQA